MTQESIPITYVAGLSQSPASPGDTVDGYVPVDQGAHFFPRPGSKEWQQEPCYLRPPSDLHRARRLRRSWCTCGHAVVTVRAGADGHSWVLIPRESIAPAARTAQHDDVDFATPMHSHPGGMPCGRVGSCKKCGRRWLVLVFEDEVQLVEVRMVGHGLRVGESGT